MGELLITRIIENYEYVALFVSVLAILFWLSLGKNPNPDINKSIKAVFHVAKNSIGKPAFVAKDGLLSAAEKNFLGPLSVVSQRLNLDLVIKVRVADLIEPATTFDKKWWRRSHFVAKKHIHCIFLDSDSRPVIAIELNDKSHEEYDDLKERDTSLWQPLLMPISHCYLSLLLMTMQQIC